MQNMNELDSAHVCLISTMIAVILSQPSPWLVDKSFAQHSSQIDSIALPISYKVLFCLLTVKLLP